jgi:arsenite methyltransferase
MELVKRLAIVLLAVLVAGCTTLKRYAYEGGSRDEWQHPDQVIRALGLQPGDRVADLGSGGGYFTFRLAAAVGPTGHVYAVDVDEDMTEYVAGRVREEGIGNVSVVLARYDDPQLPASGVDMIFTSNTYHHLQDRPAYFRHARKYLHPGGRVAILDLAGKTWFERWFGHSTPPETIRREMEAAGYRLEQEPGVVERQSFLVFGVAPE